MRVLIAVLAFAACPGCVDLIGHMDAKYVEREEKRFTVSGKPDVTLSTKDGAIEIRPWDKSEVEVVVEKRGGDKSSVADIAVNASQNDNHISIQVDWPKHNGLSFGFSKSAKLIVSVPRNSDVIAKSGDGSIDVERLAGRIELRSGDGSIKARDLEGDVNVQTGDGSIAVDGKFTALRAHTGDGSVTIRAVQGSGASGDWDVTTGDGSVTLELPDDFNGELDAHTGDGRVNINDLKLSEVSGELRRNSVRGRLGSGGRQVRVRTGDGSITLRRS
ncbi:MAG TPA: DUF4097 family beta strand repeat-containing protein [Vicinamibacterales bacterium]|jgi:DUF4097 and DUF4098 domain-containing protein YvlB